MFLRWKAETTAVPSTGDGTASSAPAGASTPISISTPIPIVRVSPVPCKLAAVHKEAGAEPYFTIAMDLTGDVNAAHELQVEWPK